MARSGLGSGEEETRTKERTLYLLPPALPGLGCLWEYTLFVDPTCRFCASATLSLSQLPESMLVTVLAVLLLQT